MQIAKCKCCEELSNYSILCSCGESFPLNDYILKIKGFSHNKNYFINCPKCNQRFNVKCIVEYNWDRLLGK